MNGMREQESRDAIVVAARATVAAGLNHGTTGNVSARASGGCLITPSAVPFETLDAGAVVAIDLQGREAAPDAPNRPSSEWRLHTAVYAAIPEAHAVVHCHPTYATALSCVRRDIPAFHYMVPLLGGADIRCSTYATYGSVELAEAMMVALAGRTACLLANHGVVTYGRDLTEAMVTATTLEVLAHQYAVALSIGTPVVLDDAEVDALLARFANYGPRSA